MDNNGLPDESEYVLIGGSIYIKLPPTHHSHHEIEHLKKEDKPDRTKAKIMKEKNREGELYSSIWNPNAESQKSENQ